MDDAGWIGVGRRCGGHSGAFGILYSVLKCGRSGRRNANLLFFYAFNDAPYCV